MQDDEKPDPMYQLTGQAVVEWSRVELMWAFVFERLLFDGIGDAVEFDHETQMNRPRKDDVARSAR